MSDADDRLQYVCGKKMNKIEGRGPARGKEIPPRAKLRSKVKRGRMQCLETSILALILALALLGTAVALTITVCESGCENTSIKSALNHSKPGDIIEVHGGTYYENLDIRGNVSLVGIPDEKGMPVIDGGGHGSVIVINIDGVSISGQRCICEDR
jgi:hypothetical protein